jgi:transposase InsO family protein
MIGQVHNSIAGHHGVDRTIKKLLQLHPKWEYMRQHVVQYIAKCPCCQKMSKLKMLVIAHPFTTSTYTPMECLNVDFIGPYPDGGYVLVIVDTFTRWIELFHSEDATAKSAATHLLHQFGRFGAPNKLRSDRGPHFIALVIKTFMSMVGVDHCLTLAYSSEENAIVERQNKEVNRHLVALTFDHKTINDYKELLPFVQRIMNASVNTRTGVSPAQMLFGNAIRLDQGVFLPREERPDIDTSVSAELAKMLKQQDALIKIAQDNLIRTDQEHMSASLAERSEHPIHSYVLVRYRENRDGHAPSRLLTSWKGPMRVIASVGSEYTLLDLVNNKSYQYHVKDMKAFNFDPLLTDPLEVAAKDRQEYLIDKVLAHTGDVKRVSSLEFKILWLGYPLEEASWVPWANVRDSEALHTYLRTVKLSKLIPAKFRTGKS